MYAKKMENQNYKFFIELQCEFIRKDMESQEFKNK